MDKLKLFLVTIIVANIFYEHSCAQKPKPQIWYNGVEVFDNNDSLIKNGWTHMFSTKLGNKVMFENYYYSCIVDTGMVRIQVLQLYTEFGKKHYYDAGLDLKEPAIITKYHYYINLRTNKVSQTYGYIWDNNEIPKTFCHTLDQIGFRRPQNVMEVQLVMFFKKNYL